MGLVFHTHTAEKYIPYDEISLNRKKRMIKKIRKYVEFLKENYSFFKAITLTFRGHSEFLEFVKDGGIRTFFDILRKKLRIKFKYVYVLEIQRRGVFHYHILLALEKSVYIPPVDKVGWWKYGFSRIQNLSIPSKNYLSKYLEKQDQKEVKQAKKNVIGILKKQFYLFMDVSLKKIMKFVRNMKMFYYSVLDNIFSFSTILQRFKKKYDWKYIIQRDKLGQGFYIVGLSVCGVDYYDQKDISEIVSVLQEFWEEFIKENKYRIVI